MTTRQPPIYDWRPNANGVTRSKTEALEIAKQWGVVIPDEVDFSIDPIGLLDHNTYAKTTTFKEPDGTFIDWSWFVHKKTGKIPFLIRPDVFASDETIVAVIGHEMYELAQLRQIFPNGAYIEHWANETCPDNPGNCHWLAWEYADQLVAKMRGKSYDGRVSENV